ncbi:indole-3-glycerol phosphate synthase TrpC [Candidatus Viadribacter manganicus]|uniref:Indole-3-glycerol phosphate synthase n=1 Tax=Candidatus Viadribacter manganicus TaxID=1759059 RepID=A0A1B1ADB3_9PROT|nr:indole-3-glycerol phosphate synthase TrpC [Candidatus Viadribacter manganicus]ANP44542.1 indole-3-glycerol phosphate synthase [Candidatus Viadribacter manganicus]
MSVLERIVAYKRDEVAARKTSTSQRDLDDAVRRQTPPRGFARALKAQKPALIAEIKKASPSKGLIRADFNPAALAQAYALGGATCLSVLTDAPSFQGHEDYLVAARTACSLPVLRKDFMVDEWQIAESRSIGADAILIILAVVDDALASDLNDAAEAYGMDALVEVHDESEMARALRLGFKLIGINNRSLATFETDLGATERLAAHVSNGATIVSESGIFSHEEIARLSAAGASAFLVGESLMRQADVAKATRSLLRR